MIKTIILKLEEFRPSKIVKALAEVFGDRPANMKLAVAIGNKEFKLSAKESKEAMHEIISKVGEAAFAGGINDLAIHGLNDSKIKKVYKDNDDIVVMLRDDEKVTIPYSADMAEQFQNIYENIDDSEVRVAILLMILKEFSSKSFIDLDEAKNKLNIALEQFYELNKMVSAAGSVGSILYITDEFMAIAHLGDYIIVNIDDRVIDILEKWEKEKEEEKDDDDE